MTSVYMTMTALITLVITFTQQQQAVCKNIQNVHLINNVAKFAVNVKQDTLMKNTSLQRASCETQQAYRSLQ